MSLGTTDSATSVPSPQHSLSPSLQQYAKYLKEIYSSKRASQISDQKFNLLRANAKSFINIVLVHKESVSVTDNEMLMNRMHGHIDDIQKRKTKLQFSDVCKCEDGSLAHSVLVEGAPGVGKTTFASELCKQWARGELLQEWSIVIMIKLRDRRARAAKSLKDLLYHPDTQMRREIKKELRNHNGEGILLIFDGYDESQQDIESVIYQIMQGKALPQATLMVTSRPLATRTLPPDFKQPSINQHIEVLGFTRNNVEEFINSACEDKPELLSDFKSYLSTHPFLSSLMYNPLHCAIVTNIYYDYWEHGQKEYAPKTLTELYTGLVHTLLLRYLTDHHEDRDWRIRNFKDDLPDDVKQNLEAITSLAANGIKRRQYVFDEVDDNVPSDTLGLMQREEQAAVGIGTSSSYYFLHLTLQEYLAAVRYSEQLDLSLELLLAEEGPLSLKSFLKHYGEEINSFSSAVHWPVALFIAGRTRLNGVPANLLQAGLHHETHKHVTYVNVSLLHLLYETQCPQLIQSTLVTSEQYLSVSGSSALDWFVIGYCIATSASKWQVRKQSKKKITRDHMHQLAMGLDLGFKTSYEKGKIASLQITDKSWMKISNILEWLQLHTKSITELKLVGQLKRNRKSSLKCTDCRLPATQVIYPELETLEIEYGKTIFPSFILNIIGSQLQNNLQTLLLTKCDFNSGLLLCILQFPNSRVQNLTLSKCTITIPDDTHKSPTSHKLEFKLKTTDKMSLEVTSSSVAISHILLRPLFCADTLNEMTVELDPPSSAMLNIVTSQYPMLESLEIHKDSMKNWTSRNCYLSSSVFSFSLQQNNLHTLSFYWCKLNSEATSSLIHSLQSPHCKLRELTLDFCDVSIVDSLEPVEPAMCSWYSLSFKLKCYEIVSLDVAGSSRSISQMLSKSHFYSPVLNEIAIYLYELDEKKSTPLEVMISQYPMLKKLHIKTETPKCRFLSPSVVKLDAQQNNLWFLSLRRCKFNCEATCSLFQFLQSPHCKLHSLELDECIFSDDTASFKLTQFMLSYHTQKISLHITGSSYAISQMLSQSHFYMSKLTEMIIQSEFLSLPSVPLKIATTQFLMLDTLRTFSCAMICPSSFSFSSQQNNLLTLSLKCCKFSTEAISSLISSLQSPHCRLQKLLLEKCFIFCLSCSKCQELTLELNLLSTGRMSLNIRGYSCILSRIIQLLHLIAGTVTKIQINVMKDPERDYSMLHQFDKLLSERNAEFTILKTELSKYTMMECFQITCYSEYTRIYIPSDISPVPDFSSLKNNLFTLSLKGITLASETISLLFQFLQSPNCRLDKMVVHCCKISAPDHTRLIIAVTSCTSIKCLSIDLITDTPLLTELANGLKHNRTLETLGIYDNRNLFNLKDIVDDFTDDQFQVLIESVDGSAIETLWLRDYNKERLCVYPLSRKNVKILWYDNLFFGTQYHIFLDDV